jgi:hypothetical protein
MCVRNLLIATGKNGRAGARLRFTLRLTREKFGETIERETMKDERGTTKGKTEDRSHEKGERAF